MRLVSKSAFARERKVHPSRVTQWIRDGRVVLTAGGRVDADASHARLDNTLDPTKGVRTDGNVTSSSPALNTSAEQHAPGAAAMSAAAPVAGTDLLHDAEPSATSAGSTSSTESSRPPKEEQVDWDARRRKDRADAQLAEMKALQVAGALTSVAEVQRERMETARQVRNAMLAIPDRLAPVLDPANPARAHKLLTDEISKALRELRSGLEQRAAAAAAGADEREPALL
jgi:phage terminase Nu1 subunit (DNA packaging protein)